jgi:hypothetical protein
MQFNHLHPIAIGFDWVEPRDDQVRGYFEIFIDFRALPQLISEKTGKEGRLNECHGIFINDEYDEAYIWRLLGKEVDSPEIRSVIEKARVDYSNGLVWEEEWTPIYVAACCGDIGCGGLVTKVVFHEGSVEWRFWEDWLGPFIFEESEYQRSFDDLRSKIEKRKTMKAEQKAT